MKKLFLRSLAVGLVLGIGTAWAQVDVDFFDVDESTDFNEEITWMAANRVIDGYDDGTFRPGTPVNRAEFLKMIYLMQGLDDVIPEATDNAGFSDVEITWYTRYVKFAKERGTVEGYPDGTFRPGDRINRVEALKIIMEEFRVLNNRIKDADVVAAASNDCFGPQRDIADVSADQWYAKYLAVANEACLIPQEMLENEVGNEVELMPGDFITRGEVAAAMYRAKAIDDLDLLKYDGQEPKMLDLDLSESGNAVELQKEYEGNDEKTSYATGDFIEGTEYLIEKYGLNASEFVAREEIEELFKRATNDDATAEMLIEVFKYDQPTETDQFYADSRGALVMKGCTDATCREKATLMYIEYFTDRDSDLVDEDAVFIAHQIGDDLKLYNVDKASRQGLKDLLLWYHFN